MVGAFFRAVLVFGLAHARPGLSQYWPSCRLQRGELLEPKRLCVPELNLYKSDWTWEVEEGKLEGKRLRP